MHKLLGQLLCKLGVHDWSHHLRNVLTDEGDCRVVTVGFVICKRCAASKLTLILE